VRKWKKIKEIGEADWEFEIGETQKAFNPDQDIIAVNSDNVKSFFELLANILKEGHRH
jgi:hypothetical protein